MKKRLIIKSKLRFFTFILVAVTILTGSCGLVSAKCAAANNQDLISVNIHAGDTLWNIACEYVSEGTDVREYVYDICKLNDITADELYTGMTIQLPVK